MIEVYVAIAVYLAGWLWMGMAFASVTDESRMVAFMMGGLWPLFPFLIIIDWLRS